MHASDDQIKPAQQQLQSLGYYKGKIDGVLGDPATSKTIAAMEAFRKDASDAADRELRESYKALRGRQPAARAPINCSGWSANFPPLQTAFPGGTKSRRKNAILQVDYRLPGSIRPDASRLPPARTHEGAPPATSSPGTVCGSWTRAGLAS
jgi:peptidoglycan hydrolase-like protein with peptidoglycan-binding domain